MISNGRSECVPVAAKYGEQPIRRLTVTLSAQNTKYADDEGELHSPKNITVSSKSPQLVENAAFH